METLYGWIVVAVAAAGVLLGVIMLTRFIRYGWLRWMLRALVAVWLIVPSPIQVVEGHYAPAFVVAIFEGVFNRDGNPMPALTALGLSTAVVVIAFLAAALVQGRRSPA